jgi:glycosyltransferase involved in cell wall biosynthesis
VVGHDGNVDALPTVLLEAMAAARPVVSTQLSGIPEIVVHGETGLLVPPGDSAALADALATILERPEWAAAMGRTGLQRAERQFDLFANAAVLRRLLHGGAGAA